MLQHRYRSAVFRDCTGVAVVVSAEYEGDMAVKKNNPETDALQRSRLVSVPNCWVIPGLMITLLLFLFHSSVLAGDLLLYLPNPVDSAAPPLPAEGVLVKKITIKQGDTLAALSRQFSGKGVYYPQILLFNKIRNPNLIYAGQELLVPLSGRLFRKMQSDPVAGTRTTSGVPPVTPSRQERVPDKTTGTAKSSAERQLFEQSVALFAQGKYHEALDGFDRFLKFFPHSPLVPNASLYRGDCFLRLSEI